jgi:ABC-type dipeptide/oligopeptide/nickel transport system permease component
MLAYILRRILLMIPTLFGITFLVFMLIAMSPGGIGAGLLVSGGGAMDSQSAIAIQKAKLEDRYGLNEHAVVQYFRWLGRISPIRFGQQDLVSPSGERIARPRPVPQPTAYQWLGLSLPTIDSSASAKDAADLAALAGNAKVRAFSRIDNQYISARAKFTAEDATAKDALKRYAQAVGRDDLLTGSGDLRLSGFLKLTPNTALPEYLEAKRLSQIALSSYAIAVAQRDRYIAAMATDPLPRAGLAIIPNVLSLTTPDLGMSFSRGRPVAELIGSALPVTIVLNIIATVIIYTIAVPGGMLAATNRGSWIDVLQGGAVIALYSIPAVLAGVLAQGFLANPDYLGAFPTAGINSADANSYTYLPYTYPDGRWEPGFLLDRLYHIALPVACLVYGGFAVLSKQTRAAMLENFNADYVRTAKAKGVHNRDVVLRHVFRNSLLPLITMFVTVFPAMLAGSVVIERIFSVPGMGLLLIEAINLRDREIILANAMIIAVVNLLALLLADILYAAADPRITFK